MLPAGTSLGRQFSGNHLMTDRKTAAARGLPKSDYEMLAAFRYALRRFLSFSEAAASDVGLAPQQYQALLVIKGYPGRDTIAINELAAQLLIKHHSAVGLVDRLEGKGLVTRSIDPDDRRKVNVGVTPRGSRLFEGLAAAHRAELARIGSQFADLFGYFAQSAARTRRPRRGSS